MSHKFKIESVTTTAKKLLSAVEIAGHTSVLIQPITNPIRVRFDGVKPTTSSGIQVAAGGSYIISGPAMHNLWAIAETGISSIGVNLQ